jgi:hypothetical protein
MFICALEMGTAVFHKASENLEDKWAFFLFVLGPQNSHKTPLLNAMLGLQFSDSAGRYSWGIYMQLLKVERMLRD